MLFAFHVWAHFLLSKVEGCPAALCQSTSFPTTSPTLDIINLASTNWEVEYGISLFLPWWVVTVSIIVDTSSLPPYTFWLHLLPRLSVPCSASALSAAKGPVILLPRAKQFLAQESRILSWQSTCSQANQLADSYWHLQGYNNTDTGSFWATIKRAECFHRGLKQYLTNFKYWKTQKWQGSMKEKFHPLPPFYRLLWGTVSMNKLLRR